MAKGFQSLTISKRKLNLRCSAVFLMHFLIQLWCCFAISIIFIFMHLFRYFNCFKWAFVCYHLASFLFGRFATYFGQILIFNEFFVSHFYLKGCFVESQFIHKFYGTFYAAFIWNCWLWMIQCHFIVLAIILMTYCFNDISMTTVS